MLILKEYALSMLEYHLLDPCSDPYGLFTQWIGLILADSLPHSFFADDVVFPLHSKYNVHISS